MSGKRMNEVCSMGKYAKSKTENGSRVYICEEEGCGRKFASIGYMKYHATAHNGQKTFKCEFEGCDRKFSWPTHLKYHVMTHTGSRLYKCPCCNKSFYTSQRLKVHRRSHTGEKPFQCTEDGCEKSFTTAGNLKNHIRVHTGDRPFVCTFKDCGKGFAEKSSLKKHNLVHTGLKPFKCKICNKSFSQSGSRNVHVKRRHSEHILDEKIISPITTKLLEPTSTNEIDLQICDNVVTIEDDLSASSEIPRLQPDANVVVLMQPENISGLQFVDGSVQEEIVFDLNSFTASSVQDNFISST